MKNRNIVYSTDSAFQKRCQRCGSYPCRCPKPKSVPPAEQTAHIRRETKGRGGKTVIVISNLQLTPEDMKELARVLKQACGAGGAVRPDGMEIQGENRDQVVEKLRQLGYKTKLIGG